MPGIVALAFLLEFSRYGNLKLGGEGDEDPGFSIGAWFPMLFAAGMVAVFVFRPTVSRS